MKELSEIYRLREAMGTNPCTRHKDACSAPNKRQRKCNWGHSAIEFVETCDVCALIFIKALKRKYTYSQRLHHISLKGEK